MKIKKETYNQIKFGVIILGIILFIIVFVIGIHQIKNPSEYKEKEVQKKVEVKPEPVKTNTVSNSTTQFDFVLNIMSTMPIIVFMTILIFLIILIFRAFTSFGGGDF